MTTSAANTDTLHPTASQTVGPFFHIGFDHLRRSDALTPNAARVTVHGRIIDGDGVGVPDAAVEIWQADSAGVYSDDVGNFRRVHTDGDGRFSFGTVRPGPTAHPDGAMQAPHLVVLVFMRGLLKPVLTRMYFPDDGRNDSDPILSRLVPVDRRPTLVARAESPDVVTWTIVLRGANETVFFEC